MPFVIFRRDLGEYGTSSEVGAIGFDAKGFGRVRRDEDQGRRHIPLEFIKGGDKGQIDSAMKSFNFLLFMNLHKSNGLIKDQ